MGLEAIAPFIGPAMSIGSSLFGSDTAKNAGQVGSEGAARAAGLTAEQYADTVKRLNPYTTNGANGSNKLAYLLGTGSQYGRGSPAWQQAFDTNRANAIARGADASDPNFERNVGMEVDAGLSRDGSLAGGDDQFGALLKKYTGEDLLTDPGYEFRRSEGQKGVERSAAGRGGLFSGQAGKELERYNQGFASNEFDKGFNRDASSKNQIYTMLSGQAGQGLNAEGILATAGANSAGRQGEYITQGANAEAAGMVGSANAITNGVGQYQNYNLLNSIYNKTAGKTPSSYRSTEAYPGFFSEVGGG